MVQNYKAAKYFPNDQTAGYNRFLMVRLLFLQSITLAQDIALGFGQMGVIGFPSWAEADMPAPEASGQ